jgi:hypothetical protein
MSRQINPALADKIATLPDRKRRQSCGHSHHRGLCSAKGQSRDSNQVQARTRSVDFNEVLVGTLKGGNELSDASC